MWYVVTVTFKLMGLVFAPLRIIHIKHVVHGLYPMEQTLGPATASHRAADIGRGQRAVDEVAPCAPLATNQGPRVAGSALAPTIGTRRFLA